MTKVEEIIKEGKIEFNEVEDKSLIWDTIKAKIRGFCLKFSFLRNREKNRKETELSTLIRKMETKPRLSEEEQQKKAEAEEELRQINEKPVPGMAIRAHATWCEEGEHSTKYFFNLEKRNYRNKCITKLIKKDSLLTEPNETLKEEQQFYEALYKKDPLINANANNGENFFEKPQGFHGINEDWKRMCDAPLSMEDILKAVISIKNNKSPGSDGFTVEFYKRFWDDIKGNMHMISPDRTRFCCHILTYLVTIHLLYGTRCLSY